MDVNSSFSHFVLFYFNIGVSAIVYPLSYQAYDAMVIYLCDSFNTCMVLYVVHSTSTFVGESF